MIALSPHAIAVIARRLAALGAAGTGALGTVGLVAWLQAQLAMRAPAQRETGYVVDGEVGLSDRDANRVVWLGDSLAAGLGAIAPDVSLPRLVAATRGDRSRLHVFAKPGATSDDVVHHQLPALELLRHGLAEIGQDIDAIGVIVGANDLGAFTPRRRFRRNVRAIVSAAEGTPMVLVSIPELSQALRLPHPLRKIASVRARQLDAVIRSVAAGHPHVRYASVRRRPEWIAKRDLHRFLAPDRFHPNGAGYGLWAAWVAEAFDQLLGPPVSEVRADSGSTPRS